MRDEVELAAEEQGKRKRVERQVSAKLGGLQPAGGEMLLPLAERLIVVSQSDTVRAVAYPVHGPQSCVVERGFAEVVFQDDMGARDAGGFAEELRDVGGVVKDVDEEANVEGLIRERELRAVKGTAVDSASGARSDFHSLNGEIGPALGEQAGDRAIAATNVQDSLSSGRK